MDEIVLGEVSKVLVGHLSGAAVAGVGRLMELVRHKADSHSVALPRDADAVTRLLDEWRAEDPEWADRVITEWFEGREGRVNAISAPPSPFHDRVTECGGIPETGVMVVSGQRGAGKTALTRKVAADRASTFAANRCTLDLDRFRDGPVLLTASAMREVLLQHEVDTIAEAEPELSAQYWSLLAQRRVVFVLENVCGLEDVLQLAPIYEKNLVLVTTRNLTEDLDGEYPSVALGGLDEASAREMLAERLGTYASVLEDEPEQTDELLARFGCLPYAIKQLAVLLKKKAGAPGSVSSLLDRFARLGITDVSEMISHALADTVGQLSGRTVTAFLELARHPRGEFTQDSAEALLGYAPDTVLGELQSVGLVHPVGSGRYRMDWFARKYADELATERGRDTDIVLDRLLVYYAELAVAADLASNPKRLRRYLTPAVTPWSGKKDRIKWLDAEADVLVELAEWAVRRGQFARVGQLCAGLEVLMLHRGRFDTCLPALEAGVRAAEQLAEQALLARQYALCGRANAMLHMFDDARSNLDRARQIVAELDDPRLESSIAEMSGRFFEVWTETQAVRDYRPAAEALLFAVEIDRRIGDDTAFALHARMAANVLVKDGYVDDALALLEEAAVRTDDPRSGSRICLVRAKAYLAQGKLTAAAGELARSRRHAKDADATGYADETDEVEAMIAARRGDYGTARSIWGRLLVRCLGNGHPKSAFYQDRLNELPD